MIQHFNTLTQRHWSKNVVKKVSWPNYGFQLLWILWATFRICGVCLSWTGSAHTCPFWEEDGALPPLVPCPRAVVPDPRAAHRYQSMDLLVPGRRQPQNYYFRFIYHPTESEYFLVWKIFYFAKWSDSLAFILVTWANPQVCKIIIIKKNGVFGKILFEEVYVNRDFDVKRIILLAQGSC